MPLKADQIETALKRKPVLLVAGDEPLLVEEAADSARSVLRAAGFASREVHHVDRGFDWDALSADAATASLFAERRLLELRFQASVDAAAGNALRELAAHLDGDTALLAIAGPMDARARKAKWFGELDKAVALVYCWALRREDFPAWIRQRLGRLGLRAGDGVVDAVVGCSEGNPLAAAQLLRQLQALCEGRAEALTGEEVLALGADMARFDAFALMDRAFAGDVAGALRAVDGLRRAAEPLPMITGGLAFVLRQWHGAQVAYAASGDAMAAARSVGVFPPRAQQLARALQRSRPAEVQGLLRRLAEIDTASKQGNAAAAWDELLTWAALASGAKAAAGLPRSLIPLP